MLRDLAPAEGGASVELIDEPTAEQAAAFYAAAREHGFAFALDAVEPASEDAEEEELAAPSLLDIAEAAEKKTHFSVGVCADPARALRLPLTPELRALLEDASVPKRVHDWKLALHVLGEMGVALRGPVDDSMLLSYALNPTHSTQSLADVAARNSQPPPTRCPHRPRPFMRSSPRCAKRLKRPACCASTPTSICRSRPCSIAWSWPASTSTQLR